MNHYYHDFWISYHKNKQIYDICMTICKVNDNCKNQAKIFLKSVSLKIYRYVWLFSSDDIFKYFKKLLDRLYMIVNRQYIAKKFQFFLKQSWSFILVFWAVCTWTIYCLITFSLSRVSPLKFLSVIRDIPINTFYERLKISSITQPIVN